MEFAKKKKDWNNKEVKKKGDFKPSFREKGIFFPFFAWLPESVPPLTYMCGPGSRRRKAKVRLEKNETRERLTVELTETQKRSRVRTKPVWEMSRARNKNKGKKVWQKWSGKSQHAADCSALERLVNHSPPDTQRAGEPGLFKTIHTHTHTDESITGWRARMSRPPGH